MTVHVQKANVTENPRPQKGRSSVDPTVVANAQRFLQAKTAGSCVGIGRPTSCGDNPLRTKFRDCSVKIDEIIIELPKRVEHAIFTLCFD